MIIHELRHHVELAARCLAQDIHEKHRSQRKVLSNELTRPEALYTDMEMYAYSAALLFVRRLRSNYQESEQTWDDIVERYRNTFLATYQGER